MTEASREFAVSVCFEWWFLRELICNPFDLPGVPIVATLRGGSEMSAQEQVAMLWLTLLFSYNAILWLAWDVVGCGADTCLRRGCWRGRR